MADVRPEIRGTAAWSLGRIGTEEALEALRRAAEREKDEAVLGEINKATGTLEAGRV
ncbi:hypothetical protein D3C71_2238760 [compost metagenome]